MKLLLYISMALVMLPLGKASAQLQPRFAQYVWNSLPINPAVAGKDEALSMVFTSRKMWTGVSGSPSTQNFSAHMPIPGTSLGIGALLYRDELGVQSTTGVRLQAAYRLKTGKGHVAFGLSAGVCSMLQRWSNIVTITPDDVSFSAGDQQDTQLELGSGLFYQGKKSFLGISSPSFSLQPNSENPGIPIRHIQAIGGTNVRLTKTIDWKPSFFLDHDAMTPWRIEITQLVEFNDLLELGMALVPQLDWKALLRMKVNSQFSLSYTYDHYTGILNHLDNGSHEIGLMYLFRYNSHSPDTRMYPAR